MIVWTSEIAPVLDNPGWQLNTAKNWFNTKFGFGLMNADGLVKEAINWIRVPEKSICIIKAPRVHNNTIKYKQGLTVAIETSGCVGTRNEIKYLEHVEVMTTINYTRRGSLEVYLTSPTGFYFYIIQQFKDYNLLFKVPLFNYWEEESWISLPLAFKIGLLCP